MKIPGVLAGVVLCLTGCFSHPVQTGLDRDRNAVSRDPYRLASLVEGWRFVDDRTRPADPLQRILWQYSPEAWALVRRAEAMSGEIRVGDAWRIMPEGSGLRTIRNADGSEVRTVLTNRGFWKWIDRSKPFLDQLSDACTAVHELCHAWNSRAAAWALSQQKFDHSLAWQAAGSTRWLIRYTRFYLGRDNMPLALDRMVRGYPEAAAFPAKRIASLVPERLRTFRYKTYVGERANHSCQSTGISGLLDEYNAYYWSNRVPYELYDYFRSELPATGATWVAWLKEVRNHYFAWAEFRLWILAWLRVAEKEEPAVWRSVMEDTPLRRAFTVLDDEFTALVHKLFVRVFETLPAQLGALGLEVRLRRSTTIDIAGKRHGDLAVHVGNGFQGFMSYSFTPLVAEMNTPEYLRIANTFRLSPQGRLPELPPVPER